MSYIYSLYYFHDDIFMFEGSFSTVYSVLLFYLDIESRWTGRNIDIRIYTDQKEFASLEMKNLTYKLMTEDPYIWKKHTKVHSYHNDV